MHPLAFHFSQISNGNARPGSYQPAFHFCQSNAQRRGHLLRKWFPLPAIFVRIPMAMPAQEMHLPASHVQWH
jgi:hypothetical protein